IPVIFLTAHNNEDSEIKGFSMGVVDYIKKPFSPPRLLKRIESHLAMEAQRKELAKYSKNLEKMVEEGTQKLVTLKNVLMETMSELVEHRDMVTGGHIERTQLYVGIMLDAMIEKGVYKQEIEQIDANLARQSSQLHDIGKISVKDSILMKPGRLTEDEFEEIKQHTKFGERIIAKIQEKVVDSDFLEYAKVFAAFHHEKWDGSGYHTGLRGQDIPLLGRVMAIADVYDALTTSRPYKDAFPHEKAVDIIQKDRGTHFDPALVDLFLEFQDKFEEIANNNS
ncbi:MAG: HD domain-containing protein, partial [Defluviitaleaceae bacterium]|nr:HD domain-containing protein [Defluviitaleaceae bacterium]